MTTDDTAASPPRRSALAARIAENRRLIDVELADDHGRRMASSPALHGLTNALLPVLRAHAKGVFLDAGCGTQPFRSAVEAQVERYVAYDIEARTGQVDAIGDIEAMHAIGDDSIDVALCSEVLEHVPHPHVAMRELARTIRPGGVLALTVPFLARLHEEPHDYFRYTRHGIRQLLDDAGFELDEIVETGSLFSFVGHQVSLGLLGLTWHRRWLRRIAVALNRALVVRPAVALDRITRMGRLLPLGYVAVGRRHPN
jgi:SAM-dependent methyltransferase